MKRVSKTIFPFIFLFLCIPVTAQPKSYTTANAHSHNDYLNPSPFYTAFKYGFGSIEADVFPGDMILYVAHQKNQVKPELTLQNLYVNPIRDEFASGRMRNLKLLIDIKENYKVTLPLLIKELEPLRKYLFTLEKPNYLTIIISGNRPPPAEYNNYPSFIFFDADMKLPHTDNEWRRVALVSLSFSRISAWKADAALSQKDRKALRAIIDSAHAAGKPIRFWAAPDTKTSWKWQMKLGVDLIGTDKIMELGNFLGKKNTR